MKTEVETIDRELAERYLDLDRGNNRPFSPYHLADLIGRQRRGEWIANGDTIRFDTDDQLRDGVHRLRMVKATGIPIEVIVVRDIAPEAFITMDVGKKRSLGDVLYIEKETNHTQLAGALGWVWRYLSRRMIGRAGSYEEHHRVLESHPKIRDSVAFYLNLNRPVGAPGFPQITMGIHYLFSCIDATAADDFVTRYVTGLGFSPEEAGNPIHVIREQIASYAKDPRAPHGSPLLALLARAWNAHRAGQIIKKRFKVPFPRKSASPRIDGFPKDLFVEGQLWLPENEEEEEGE